MGGFNKSLSALAISAISLGCGPAFAQDQPPAEPEAEASTITPYPATFFTEFRPNTARDMINRIPGFSFDGGSGARGFAGNAGNVLIDGERPASRSDSLGDILSRIPASAVARIDLIRGGAPGIDMQGRAIVANVIRRTDSSLTTTLNEYLSLDGDGNFGHNGNVQVQHKTGGRLLEGSLSYIDDTDTNFERRIRQNTDGSVREYGLDNSSSYFRQYEGTGALETALLGGKVRLNGQASMQDYGGEGLETLLTPVGENRGRNSGARDAGESGLRFTRNLGAGFDMELVAFQSLYQSTNRNDDIRPAFTSGSISESEGGESIGSAAFHSPAYGAWSFDAGSELAFNFVETTILRTIDGKPISLEGDSSRVEELRSDSHLVATWNPMATLNVETGLRYERSTISAGPIEKTLGYVKPRLNVSWTPRAGHQVQLRVERLVDQLSFGAFQSSVSFNSSLGDSIFGVGNNDLEPSHYWLFDARYERRWAREGVFIAQISHRMIDDNIARAVIPAPTPSNPNRTFEITKNVGEAVRTTYSLDTTIPLDDLGVSGGLFQVGLDLRDSEMIDPVTDLTRRVSGDEPFGWNVTLSRNVQAKNLTWTVYASGGDEATNFSPRSVSFYENDYSVGASFSWRPRPDVTIGGGVNNITRGDDHSGVTFYTAPRNIGVPDYLQQSYQPGVQEVFLNLRKTFS